MNKDNVTLIELADAEAEALSAKQPGAWQLVRNRLIADFSRRHFMDMWRDVPLNIRFRCTNRCNENCPRCFECSGPQNPLQVLPAEDIAFYQNSLSQIKSVYVTGGEWSLIYEIDSDYMMRVFEGLDLRNSNNYSLQTNCRWVFGPNRDKIYSDLKQIQDKLAAAGKVMKLDVSVDRYRSKASLDGVRELICHIAKDDKFQNTKVRILSSRLDYRMTNDVVLLPEYFASRGVKLRFEKRDLYNLFFQVFYANDKRMIIHEEGVTMQIGRAAKNNIGYKIFDPEHQCAGFEAANRFIELSFREDGTVKWHNYSDWDIIISYKDAAGQNKPIDTIKQELLNKAWRRHLKQSIINTLWDSIPVINVIHQRRQEQEKLDSFRKNQAVIAHQARGRKL